MTRYRRRPGPIGTLFWLMITVCILIAIAEVNPPITAPFAFLLLVLIVAGIVGQRQARRQTAAVSHRPRSSVERVTIAHQERDCGTCGAPVQPGAARCPFCSAAYWRGGVQMTTERVG